MTIPTNLGAILAILVLVACVVLGLTHQVPMFEAALIGLLAVAVLLHAHNVSA